MAIDLAALKAKLAARKAGITTGENNEKQVSVPESLVVSISGRTSSVSSSPDTGTGTQVTLSNIGSVTVTSTIPTVSAPTVLGTSKTTEIDHIDFLSKMNSLAAAIHNKHPTMPVLLMQIHKQLRADPELVTTLDEDAIGIIVSGLQIQTKTELVSVVVKESKSKAKKIALTADML